MIRQRPPRENEAEESRKRRYNAGALAQSYAPQGVADLLFISAKGRAKARAQWAKYTRRERIAMYVVGAFSVVCLGLIALGFALHEGWLLLTGALAAVVLMLATTAGSAISEVRASRSRRDKRMDSKTR